MKTLTRKSFLGSTLTMVCAPFAVKAEAPKDPLDCVEGRIIFGEEDHDCMAGIGISFETGDGLYRNAFAMGSRGKVSDLIAGLRNMADALEGHAKAAIERYGIA